MNFRRWVLFTIFFCLFSASFPSARAAGPSEVAASDPPTIAAPALPCAEVKKRFVTDAVTVLYTSQNIYRNGAALPKLEGMTCLEVLVDWLKSVPQVAWQITVGGVNSSSIDPQALANKRQELLQRYFYRQGIDTSSWSWQAVAWRVNGKEVELQLKSSL